MERVKSMPRNAASAADADAYRPELIGEDEPRYLRRQKPVEIRRKKFAGKSWSFYRRMLVLGAVAIAGFTAAGVAGEFLLYSPQVALLRPDQLELSGNRIVTREAVLQQFARDRGHSILRVPLDARRSAIEELPWVESASVQRILPNHIRVQLTERTPIAFLRNGTELALIDAHGVILDRPRGENLQFPIVVGLSESMPRDERGRRMQTYQEFVRDIDQVRPRSSDRVSEIDLGQSQRPTRGDDWHHRRQRFASRHHPVRAERFRRKISDGGRQFRAVAGQQRPRALHRFAIFAPGDSEHGHQRRGDIRESEINSGRFFGIRSSFGKER